MMTGATASFLTEIMEDSGKTQHAIARQAGFRRPNVLSMMKSGEMKVPIERIPALAKACNADPAAFIRIAMAEYAPDVFDLLGKAFGGEKIRYLQETGP